MVHIITKADGFYHGKRKKNTHTKGWQFQSYGIFLIVLLFTEDSNHATENILVRFLLNGTKRIDEGIFFFCHIFKQLDVDQHKVMKKGKFEMKNILCSS